MGSRTEEYCDLCGQLLYHSTHSWSVIMGKERWWWHGDAERPSEVEICQDCCWVIQYLVAERQPLVQDIRKSLSGKSPAEQMENKPKPLTKNVALRLLRKLTQRKGM